MKFGTFVPYMCRILAMVTPLTIISKLEIKLGKKNLPCVSFAFEYILRKIMTCRFQRKSYITVVFFNLTSLYKAHPSVGRVHEMNVRSVRYEFIL